MPTAGITLLFAAALLGFAQQDYPPGTQKIRTPTGLELQILLPAVNAPFRVYFAYSPASVREDLQPAKILFDTAVDEERSGSLDRAKLTLLTLARTYSAGPLAAKAKAEIGAIYIFEEAKARARSGQSQAAYNSFSVVARVYPESALAGLASTEMGNLDPEGKWKQ